MHPRNPLTDFQKGEIEALIPYLSHGEISKQLHIPRSTITSFITRVRRQQSVQNLPHIGRPRKTSDSDNRYLVRLAESNTRVPLKEIRRQSNMNISEQTIRRRLHDAG